MNAQTFGILAVTLLAPAAAGWMTMNIEKASFLGLLLLVTVAFVALLLDFFQPLFWATALAVIFFPVHKRIVGLVRGRNTLASALTLIVIVVTVLLPSWFIASAVVNEGVVAIHAHPERRG